MIKMYIENVKTAKGNWVDFPVNIEEMMENFEVENLGQLNVMDYEANFTLKNYKNIEDVNELAEILDDMDNLEKQIAENLIEEGIIVDWEDLIDAVQDVVVYEGCKNMEDVAIAIMEEDLAFDGVDERLRDYFNFKEYGETLSITGTYFEIDGAIVEYFG